MTTLGTIESDWSSDVDNDFIVINEGDVAKGYIHLSTGDEITIKPDGKCTFKSSSLSNTVPVQGGKYSGGGYGVLMALAGKVKITLSPVYFDSSGNEVTTSGMSDSYLRLTDPIVNGDELIGAKNATLNSASNITLTLNQNLVLIKKQYTHLYDDLRIAFSDALNNLYPDVNKNINPDGEYVDDELKKAWDILSEMYNKGKITLIK